MTVVLVVVVLEVVVVILVVVVVVVSNRRDTMFTFITTINKTSMNTSGVKINIFPL